MYENEDFFTFSIVYPKINMNAAKGTLIQIWKWRRYILIWKQYPEKFVFLILRVLELFAREACKFLKE